MARPVTAAVRLLTGEREPVRLATTANLETIVIDGVAWIQGLKMVDGVQTATGDRVLVKDQADARLNGIYTASEGYWYRAADARTGRTMQKGTTVHVQEGTASADFVFAFQTVSPVIGADDIVLSFYQSDDTVGDIQAAAQGIIDQAQAAADAATGAMTTVLDPQFATLAAAQAFSPPIAPTYIRTAFYDSHQVAGSGAVYRKNGTSAGDLVITLADHATIVGYSLSGTPTATQKGARKDNVNDDGPAVQAAYNLAIGGVDLPSGTYRMVPGPVSPFTLAGQPTNNIYRAVALTVDNVAITGREAVLHGVSRPGVSANDVQPVFSTDMNMAVGTRKNITFDGVTFDSVNDADAINSNQRLAYVVGVDGLRYLDTIGRSSGARRGYYSHIQNCRNVQINGHFHQKMTGGFNVRYVDSLVVTNFIFDDFSEAIDLDGTSKRVVIRNGVFKSTSRLNQCIDVNDQVDASIGDFSVFNVGNIATINYKTTTPETFADYAAGNSVRNYQLSKRILISNISGSAVGTTAAPVFYIGWDWAAGGHPGAGPVQDITLENITLDDHSYFWIREGINVKLKDITSYRAICGFNHALTCFSAVGNGDQIGWSDLDIDIDGLRIEASDKGGISIQSASRAKVRRLVTRGNNTAGGTQTDLTITNLGARAGRASVDDCDIEGDVVLNGDSTAIPAWAPDTIYKRNALVTNGGNVYRATAEGRSAGSGGPAGTALSVTDDGSASIAAWAVSTAYAVDNVVSHGGAFFICVGAGVSDAAGGPAGTDNRIFDGTVIWRPIQGAVKWQYQLYPYAIMWGKNNKVRGTVTVQGDAQKYIFAESIAAQLDDYAATGTLNKSLFVARRRGRIVRASYQTTADVAADAVNYRNLIVRRYRGGVSTNVSTIDTTAVGLTAFIARDGAVASNSAGADLEPGDVVIVNSNSAGAGRVLTGVAVTIDFMEF
ncbi:hypothetical protein [Mesorhizobium sp.]|uniref:hypothetical protein n=1 Tax=Mesorhizobium sp. TaxID=1871066 RepID=UPI0025FD56E1|nr:hypothetical protein [Mesorhizobium sp.]